MSLIQRPRRLRRTPALRSMTRETTLRPTDLVAPLFIVEGRDILRPISSMPGHAQRSLDHLGNEIDNLYDAGVTSVLLFGIPAEKDATGSGAWNADGPVPQAIRQIKRQAPEMAVIADVCLCEYTSHGHCGVLSAEDGAVLNDPTLELLARASVAYAEAGADIVAPSAMMDGQVATIRAALDDSGYSKTAILAYAAKFASAFYGPFREAAESTPQFGDRRAYQMDPANGREALRELRLDADEGADMLMVKPAGPYLDILHAARQEFNLPLAAYQVSGEYSMLKAACLNGWLDEERAMFESLIGIKRAGADIIITYFAKEAGRALRSQDGAQ
jgi:porphobilinogen synthase